MCIANRSIIRITLENISAIPVEFLHLDFEDSVKSEETVLLGEGDMNVLDAYEVEHSLTQRPVFSWDGQPTGSVLVPGKEMIVDVRCFGKPRW